MILIVIVMLAVFIYQPEEIEENTSSHLIGVLSSNDLRLTKLQGLKDGLPLYGFREGKNIKFLVKNAEGNREKLLPLAKELTKAGVEAIVTTGRAETEAAKEVMRGKDIPVVFMGLTALTQDQLVKDLLHPQEGLTGVQNDHANLSGKRLELLTKLLPEINKVLVVYDPKVVPATESLLATQDAAEKLKLELQKEPASTTDEIRSIFNRGLADVDAVLLLPSFFLESEGARILVPLAMERGVPVMGVEQGAGTDFFAIYGVTTYDQGKQAARILAKILNGQKVVDIPVEPPSELKLTVDLEVAKRLGLKIDPSILGYAELKYSKAGGSNAK